MSIKAMNWAWEQRLPPNSKLILMALADSADEVGKCWPRVRLIAEKCCASERTVQRVLKELEERGFLHIERRFRGDGGQSSNAYYLCLESPRQFVTPVSHPLRQIGTGGRHRRYSPGDTADVPGRQGCVTP
ncbi:helix-turn-helix domain-containing protein [Xanthomonas albilineans]|uniref:helix-turn-helix domain-containing protein n=1 Tax=Xanthomonas albilineans TaxID=29447 RepID=UPI003CE5AADC